MRLSVFALLVRYFGQKFPKLAATYRHAREGWRSFEEPKMTPLGFKLAGNAAMQEGSFEPEETQIVTRIVADVDVVVNVGANIGYYCCIALRQNKPVFAFEPIAANLRFLLRNVRANDWESSIEVYPLALSDKVGVIEIFGGGTAASLVKGWAGNSEGHVALVPTSTLDNILGQRLQGKRAFVIVDIEGAEGLMLKGATTILGMMPKPIWLVEIAISEHQPAGVNINPNLEATFDVFYNRGYEAWTAEKNSRAVAPSEIKEIIKTGKDTLGTHNFLFL